MFDLHGKVALVAGGAGYLGACVCQGLVQHGASLKIGDLNPEALSRLLSDLRCRFPEAEVSGSPFDVGNEISIKDLVGQTVKELGRLDILINATYFSVGKRVEELTGEEFDASLHVNITGSFLLARECSSVMSGGGSIILYSSMYGQVAPDPRIYPEPLKPNPLEYGVAKAGLEQMVRYLAVSWAPRNIRVNGIAPGPFPHASTQQQHPKFIEALCSKVPLGRIGYPNEIAGAAVFLASDEASFVTGHILNVDGGWTAW